MNPAILRGLRRAALAAALLGAAAGAPGAIVTQTVVRLLPTYQANVPLTNGCNLAGPFWTTGFTPGIPTGATILSNRLAGMVDNHAEFTGDGAVTNMAGGCGDAAQAFSLDLMGCAGADGSFTIRLYDLANDRMASNDVSFRGSNTITFTVADPAGQDTSAPGLELEVMRSVSRSEFFFPGCDPFSGTICFAAPPPANLFGLGSEPFGGAAALGVAADEYGYIYGVGADEHGFVYGAPPGGARALGVAADEYGYVYGATPGVQEFIYRQITRGGTPTKPPLDYAHDTVDIFFDVYFESVAGPGSGDGRRGGAGGAADPALGEPFAIPGGGILPFPAPGGPAPEAFFHVGNFEVVLRQTPVWHNTAVGPELSLVLQFSQYGNTNTDRPFGPRWSCNWNTCVQRLAGGISNLVTFPSGCTVPFTGTASLTKPPGALDGEMAYLAGVDTYVYRRPDGWTWTYTKAPGVPMMYYLSHVADAWSNTVSVTYASNRIQRVTQTVPPTGRFLDFTYGGAGSNVTAVMAGPGTPQRTARFSYSSAGYLTNLVDMAGHTNALIYNVNGYLRTVWEGAPGSGTRRLDVIWNLPPNQWTNTASHWVQVIDAAGVLRRFTWEFGSVSERATRGAESCERYYVVGPAGSRGPVPLRVVDASGMPEQYGYNANGRVTNLTDRTGATWRYAYTNNVVASMTDANGDVWIAQYDSDGFFFDIARVHPPAGPAPCAFTYVSNRHAVATASNAMGQVTHYRYNAWGQATNIDDGRVSWTFAYDTNGQMTAQYRNGLLHVTNGYDSARGLLAVRQSGVAAFSVSNTYDALDRVVRQTFDNNGQVSTISNRYTKEFPDQVIDRNGGVWTFVWSGGELRAETSPRGLTTRYTNGVHGRPVAVSNELGHIACAYAPNGRLAGIRYPARPYDIARAAAFEYDAAGRLTARRGLAGQTTRFEYDACGRLTASYLPDGRAPEWAEEACVLAESNRYDAAGRRIWTRDIHGLEVSLEYNALGLVTNKLYPDDTAEAWTYNAWGQPLTYRDRAGYIISNAYDGVGRLARQTDARGHRVLFGYNDADLVVAVSNEALGAGTAFSYDAEGHVTTVIRADGEVVHFAYDPMGNATQTESGGVTTELQYDPLGRLLSTTVGGLLVGSNLYDGAGRIEEEVNAEGMTVGNGYDALGQVSERRWPGELAHLYRYGGSGLTSRTDRLGITTRFVKDTRGRDLQLVDGAGHRLARQYLSNGLWQVAALFDGNSNATAWAYDTYGVPAAKTYADASGEAYLWDENRRLTNRLDPSGTRTAFAYDPNGDVVRVARGDDPAVTLARDAAGRRTNMTDGVGVTRWTYDAMGRCASEQGPFAGGPVTAAYDGLGRCTSVWFAGGAWSYQFDPLGRITMVSAPEGDYTAAYVSNGRKVSRVTYPSAVVADYKYFDLIRWKPQQITVTNAAGDVLMDVVCQYDSENRLTDETWHTGRTVEYVYDGAGQLRATVSATRPSDNADFAYDGAGNPVARTVFGLGATNAFNALNQWGGMTWTGGSLTVAGDVNYSAGTVTVNGVEATREGTTFEAAGVPVSAGTNVLAAVYHGPAFTNAGCVVTDVTAVVVGDRTLAYDANGNLTDDGTLIYQYDAANRLTNAIDKAGGASVLAVRYDGLGRRLEVTRHGADVERYLYWPGTFRVLAVTDGANQLKELCTYGPDLLGGIGGPGSLLGLTRGTPTGSVAHACHPDIGGDIVLVTDGAGQDAATYTYTALGQIVARTGGFDCRFRMAGKEYDPETGLVFFGYRYYVPGLGRWLTRDPIGEQGGENLYSYCRNRPHARYDPMGLQMAPCATPQEEAEWCFEMELEGHNLSSPWPVGWAVNAPGARPLRWSVVPRHIIWELPPEGRTAASAEIRRAFRQMRNAPPAAANNAQAWWLWLVFGWWGPLPAGFAPPMPAGWAMVNWPAFPQPPGAGGQANAQAAQDPIWQEKLWIFEEQRRGRRFAEWPRTWPVNANVRALRPSAIPNHILYEFVDRW